MFQGPEVFSGLEARGILGKILQKRTKLLQLTLSTPKKEAKHLEVLIKFWKQHTPHFRI